eukprot:TRINITY_DN4987_c0_g5_i1.p1 TRINITY_DN4987_c0_g5~~TRINITY_DN4987_c0_g5_i1.p1  ORF type:complete len:878 (+),score=293.17 TRINITY_DN4987_c0_g5_i1:85-2718(+)
MMLRLCARPPAGRARAEVVREARRTSASVRPQEFKSLTARDARLQYKKAAQSIFDKLPSLFNARVPHRDLFQNEARAGGPKLKTDTRESTRLTRRTMSMKSIALEDRPMMKTTFADMGLHPEVVASMADMQITRPSMIQQTAIAVAAEGKTVVITAPTGTGKTLAALAPMFHRMRLDREQGIELRQNRPRAVIVAPSFELVHQLWGVASRLGARSGFEVRECYGAMSWEDTKDSCTGLYDVLVTTPLMYRTMRDKGFVTDSDVKYFMFDEADFTIGLSQHKEAQPVDVETFMENLTPLLKKQFERESYLGRHKVQFYIVAASWTDDFKNRVEKWIPHAKLVHENQTHVVPRNLHHRFYYAAKREFYDYLRGFLAQKGLQPDKRHHEKVERSKTNFWFPDAVTFETGMFSPLDQGSHVLAKHGPGTCELPEAGMKSRVGSEPRPSYKQEFVEEPRYLPEPATLLLPKSQRALPKVVNVPALGTGADDPALLEGGEEAWTDGTGDALAPTTRQVLVPQRHSEHPLAVVNTAANKFVQPVVPPAPKVHFGIVKTTAAPFTGLPALSAQQDTVKGARVMVFFSTIDSLKKVAKRLVNDGYPVAVMRGMKNVLNHEIRVAEFERWAKGEVNLLLTTDIASRGLDHYVQTVINYDMPAFPVDYLNRAGRAGRFGRPGSVLNLVNRNYSTEKVFANQMEHRLAKSERLQNIAAVREIQRKPLQLWWKKRKATQDKKWLRAARIGFVNKREHDRVKWNLICSQWQNAPNPRHPLGVKSTLNKDMRQKLLKKNQHLSWQVHMKKTAVTPYGLLKMGPSQVKHVGSSVRDLRTSYLMKPINHDKAQALKKRYGPYFKPQPIHVQQMKGGRWLNSVKSNVPSMYGNAN